MLHREGRIQCKWRCSEQREAIARAESDIGRLREQIANRSFSAIEAELLRQEVKALRDRNLRESTVEERANFGAKIGIPPSEDLKSRKTFCRLTLAKVNKPNEERQHAGFAKVTPGGAQWTEQRTSALLFSLAT
jgi:hypothetical protein